MESTVTALKMAIFYNRKIMLALLLVFVVLLAALSFLNRSGGSVGAPHSARSSKILPGVPQFDLKPAALDFSGCPLDGHFKVYLYSSNDRRVFGVHLTPNQQAVFLLETLESSLKQKKMWADRPEDACAFIVLLQPFLQMESASVHDLEGSTMGNLLWSLPHWMHYGAGGRNHFIVDLVELSNGGVRLLDLLDIGEATPVLNYVMSTHSVLAPPIRLKRTPATKQEQVRDGQFSNEYATVERVFVSVNTSHEYSSILPLHRKHLFYFEGGYTKSDYHEVDEEISLLSSIQNIASYLSDYNNIHISSECASNTLPAWNGEWNMCSVQKNRLLQCKESKFSLVLGPVSINDRPGPSTYLRLIESLQCGAIPVIIGLEHLPFDDVIDWQKAALVFPWVLWQDALRTAAAMDDDVMMELRKQGKFLLHSYFSGPGVVFDSIVAVMRNKFLHPPPLAEDFTPSILKRSGELRQHMYSVEASSTQYTNYNLHMRRGRIWNSPPGPHFVYPVTPFRPLSYQGQVEGREMPLPNSVMALLRTMDENKVKNFLKMNRLDVLKQIGDMPALSNQKSPVGKPMKTSSNKNSKRKMPKYKYSQISEKFTVVTLTHHRDEQISHLVASLENCPFLDKIVVVWNNEYPIPDDMTLPELSVPIEVVSAGRNSLNNRFLPLKNIETEAILTLDDDTVLTCDDVELGFRIWRENRQSIVGWSSRVHGRDPAGSWSYSFTNVCERSLVITNAAFFHKYYSYLYTYWMPAEIREIVDLLMNCEDIAMNFLVSHISGKAMVKVGKKRTIAESNCKNDLQSGLSCLSSNHLLERDFCLNAFAEYYGYVPLIYSITRTEPLYVKSDIKTDWCDKYRDDK